MTWLENDVFLMVHTPTNFNSGTPPESIFHLVTREQPSNEHIYQKLNDPAPPFGLDRSPPHHFLLRLRDFPPNLQDLLVVASTASTDVGLFSRSKVPLTADKPADRITGVFTLTGMSDDSRRAQLPMSEALTDTSPIGVVLDLSSRENVARPIPSDEMDESKTPLPALLVLNNEGILSSWWIVYSESIHAGTPYPGLIAAAGAAISTPAQQASAFPSSISKIPFGQPAFGSPSNVGGAFGTLGKSSNAFGTGSGLGGLIAFGAPSSINKPASAWGTPSGGSPASVVPAFGKPSFGTPGVPAAQGVAFGSSAMPGSQQSHWANAGGNAPTTAFGQPSSLGMGASPTFGKPSVFGSSANPDAPKMGGFASFANQGGFAAAAATLGKSENIFASKPLTGGFSSPNTGALGSKSSFGGVTTTKPGTSGGLFDAKGFTLGSTFKPDTSTKDNTPSSEKQDGGSFFAKGFGAVLGEAQVAASPVPEESMDDSADSTEQNPSVSAEIIMETSEPIFPLSTLPNTSGTKSICGSQDYLSASKPASIFGLPTSTLSTISPGKPSGFSFGVPTQPAKTSEAANAASETPASEKIKEEPESPEKTEPNLSQIPEAPLPPDTTSKSSYAAGESSVSSLEPEVPLPSDFVKAPLPATTSKAPLGQNSSINPDSIPPVDVPLSPKDDSESGFATEDEGNQSSEGGEEESGEDVTKPISSMNQTPDISPESSFGTSVYGGRGDNLFAKISKPNQKPAGKSLFGEISGQNAPTLPPPKLQSPRSPSPVRSAIPDRLHPDAPRSVSAPLHASKILGSRSSAGLLSSIPRVQDQRVAEEALRRAAREKRAADELQALVDDEDERTQEFLSRYIEGTKILDEFIAHQDYVGTADKDSIPSQVEAVYRDINSMIDTMGMNSRTLKCFVKGHTEQYKDSGRMRKDLDSDDDWCLGEIENLSSIIDHELTKMLEDGCILDIPQKLGVCFNLERDLVKLRARAEDISSNLIANSDDGYRNGAKSLPLTAEQAAQQHDLRRDFAKFQKLLSKTEEGLTLLKAKMSSTATHRGQAAPGPTVEALVRTIKKMTTMAEKRSGDIDVLENQMRKLQFSSVGTNDSSREGSPFVTPSKSLSRNPAVSPLRGNQSTLVSSVHSYGYATPPRKKMDGFSNEDKLRLKAMAKRRKMITDKLVGVLQMSGPRIRSMDDQ
jgi:nucleoporin NUP159